MANKSKTTKKSPSIADSYNFWLDQYSVLKIEAERFIDVGTAPKGKLNVQVATNLIATSTEGDKEFGVCTEMVLSVEATYTNPETKEEITTFTLSLTIEGYFQCIERKSMFSDDEMDESIAIATSKILFPVATTFANQYISSMGYRNTTVPMDIFVSPPKVELVDQKLT